MRFYRGLYCFKEPLSRKLTDIDFSLSSLLAGNSFACLHGESSVIAWRAVSQSLYFGDWLRLGLHITPSSSCQPRTNTKITHYKRRIALISRREFRSWYLVIAQHQGLWTMRILCCRRTGRFGFLQPEKMSEIVWLESFRPYFTYFLGSSVSWVGVGLDSGWVYMEWAVW